MSGQDGHIADIEARLQTKLYEANALYDGIKMLYMEDSPQKAFEKFLQMGADYYQADRSFLFEISKENNRIDYLYEHCADGVESLLGCFEPLTYEEFEPWLKNFDQNKRHMLDFTDPNFDKSSPMYRKLRHGSDNLSVVLLHNTAGDIVGMTGVYNAHRLFVYPKDQENDFLTTIEKLMIVHVNKLKMLARVNQLNQIDPLTQRKNRICFTEATGNLNLDDQTTLGIACVDIDNFSKVNQQRGIKGGDKVLIAVADIMASMFGDEVYRVGGNRFYILAYNFAESRVRDRLDALMQEARMQLNIDLTVAFLAHDKNASINQTLNLLSAMYCEIKEKKSHITETHYAFKRNLEHKLLDDIKNNRYTVFLQPQIDDNTGLLYCAEALVRKVDEHNRIIPPIDFIELYEKDGTIGILDYYVFETVCQQIRKWKNAGCTKTFYVSVNFSRVTLIEPDFVEKLSAILQKYKFEAEKLCIEVTETVRIVSHVDLQSIVKKLKAVGFRVSLDDFGSGLSNMATLSEVEFSEIKIDKSLIHKIVSHEKSYLVLKNLAYLFRDLKFEHVVCEGVDDPRQVDLLRTLNLSIYQGYLFYKPMPMPEFAKTFLPVNCSRENCQ